MQVTLRLGTKADGTCDIAVTLPGQEARRFAGLKVVTPGWKNLTWVGFVSNATTPTVFYLDNLVLRVSSGA